MRWQEETVLRSFSRLALVTGLWLSAGPALAQPAPKADPTSFETFLQALRPEAEARGITRRTFDSAFAGLTPDARVAAATRRQPEYGRAVGIYVNSIASNARIETGARKAAEWSRLLDAIEKRYDVDRWVIIALWGIETSFGADTGGFDVIRSLATLALIGYREAYFREELLVALKILQDGHVARDRMIGSWAGAMGQPQFMPSSFVELAVDFTGDGRKDIWGNVPDVLASIANYLNNWGWKSGSSWGYEVVIPKGFDHNLSRATFAQWVELGLKRADGKSLPSAGDGILFFPSGASGPAFLVTDNFSVIKRYNNSDVFALAVGHLADRARGEGPFRTTWPVNDPQLSRGERIALQQKLRDLGFPVADFEGRFDFELRDVVRKLQAQHGMTPDGHPTRALLDRLGISAR
jgi:peptidoglycan lytic transglycosylase B